MKKDEYIFNAVSCISDKSKRKETELELRNHIDDEQERFMEMGCTEEKALEMAVARMGSAEETAQKLGRLHSNKLYIALSVLFMLLYISGTVLADMNIYEFMIISTDSTEINILSSVISTFTFLAASLAFKFSVDSKNRAVISAFGAISIGAAIASPYSFIPFGYVIIGAFTDLPARLISPSDSYGFFGSEIGWGITDLNGISETAGYIIYISMLILTLAFALFAVASAIASFALEGELRAARKGRSSIKVISRIEKYSRFLIALSLAGIVALSVEISADYGRTYAMNAEYEASYETNINEAAEAFESLELPLSYEQTKLYADPDDYYYDIEGCVTVLNTAACFVQLWDNDSDGVFESKRFVGGYSDDYLTYKEMKELDTSLTSEDIIEKYTFYGISEYNYTVCSNGSYKEYISFSIRDRNKSVFCEMHFVNGIMTEEPYISEVKD